MKKWKVETEFGFWLARCVESLCIDYQKGQKFTTLVEERDVAYFPAIVEWARGEPGQACFLVVVGSVPLLSGLVPRLRLTDPNLPFLDLAMDTSRSRSLWDALRG
jgi:hypothetical protein